MQGGRRRVAGHQSLTCEQFPKHDAHRKEVRALIDRARHRLLGRHIGDLAFENADLGFRRGKRGFCDSEIDELGDAAVRDETRCAEKYRDG